MCFCPKEDAGGKREGLRVKSAAGREVMRGWMGSDGRGEMVGLLGVGLRGGSARYGVRECYGGSGEAF